MPRTPLRLQSKIQETLPAAPSRPSVQSPWPRARAPLSTQVLTTGCFSTPHQCPPQQQGAVATLAHSAAWHPYPCSVGTPSRLGLSVLHFRAATSPSRPAWTRPPGTLRATRFACLQVVVAPRTCVPAGGLPRGLRLSLTKASISCHQQVWLPLLSLRPHPTPSQAYCRLPSQATRPASNTMCWEPGQPGRWPPKSGR